MTHNPEERPAIMQPEDPELNGRVAIELAPGYPAAQMNPKFNKGVQLGPWVAPGEGRSYGYDTEGLTDEQADAVAEDEEKARRIRANAYPLGLVGESKLVHKALLSQADVVRSQRKA
jgi:hypothetical protein